MIEAKDFVGWVEAEYGHTYRHIAENVKFLYAVYRSKRPDLEQADEVPGVMQACIDYGLECMKEREKGEAKYGEMQREIERLRQARPYRPGFVDME